MACELLYQDSVLTRVACFRGSALVVCLGKVLPAFMTILHSELVMLPVPGDSLRGVPRYLDLTCPTTTALCALHFQTDTLPNQLKIDGYYLRSSSWQ